MGERFPGRRGRGLWSYRGHSPQPVLGHPVHPRAPRLEDLESCGEKGAIHFPQHPLP